MEYKALKFEVKDINGKTGEFEGYASTKQRDVQGDVILPSAFKRTIDHNQGKLPILWFHNPAEPIGLSTHMEIHEKGLFAKGQLDLDIEKGREVYSGLQKGYIDRMSVGFRSIQAEYSKEQDARVISEAQLLEYSLVTKGFAANDAALVTSVKSLPELLQQAQRLQKADVDAELVRQTIKSLQALLADPLTRTQPQQFHEHSLFSTVMETKNASGSTDLPLAPHARAWDSSQAQQRIFEWAGGSEFDPAKARRAFFWYDNAKPNEKGSYKLPFADVIDGRLTAVPRAIFAVAAALQGARGGVDIPAEDQNRIKSKVNTYYRRMREEFDDASLTPPWESQKANEWAIQALIHEMKQYVRSGKL